jgi:hypothetical protein
MMTKGEGVQNVLKFDDVIYGRTLGWSTVSKYQRMLVVIIIISRSVHLMKKMADRNLARRNGTSCGIRCR